jgi:hypothetical protein
MAEVVVDPSGYRSIPLSHSDRDMGVVILVFVIRVKRDLSFGKSRHGKLLYV